MRTRLGAYALPAEAAVHPGECRAVRGAPEPGTCRAVGTVVWSLASWTAWSLPLPSSW